jgi:hypothetical protein
MTRATLLVLAGLMVALLLGVAFRCESDAARIVMRGGD